MISYILIAIILGYAGYTLVKSIKAQSQSKCAGCSSKNSCQTNTCATTAAPITLKFNK